MQSFGKPKKQRLALFVEKFLLRICKSLVTVYKTKAALLTLPKTKAKEFFGPFGSFWGENET